VKVAAQKFTHREKRGRSQIFRSKGLERFQVGHGGNAGRSVRLLERKKKRACGGPEKRRYTGPKLSHRAKIHYNNCKKRSSDWREKRKATGEKRTDVETIAKRGRWGAGKDKEGSRH